MAFWGWGLKVGDLNVGLCPQDGVVGPGREVWALDGCLGLGRRFRSGAGPPDYEMVVCIILDTWTPL